MIALILTLAVLGFVVWLIQTYVPMPAPFKTVIYVVVALVLILYLLSVFGIGDIPLPRAR
jgi:predicted membrane channel-forming protein YqfA (hemolysin III family)